MSSEAPIQISLGPELVHRIFPFFIAVDRDLRVRQYGEPLRKICKNVEEGVPLLQIFSLFRPRVEPAFDAFLKESHATFLFDSLTTKIRMRGQVVFEERSGLLLFIGGPWFTDISQLEQSELVLKDFTVHDPIVDFLYMVQAQQLALEDARQFSETIVMQRDELERTNEELKRASAAKSQFLANTSHELRTPLNGIIGMAALLQRSELNPTQRNYTDKILRSAEALLTVVNDVLDFSKIEAGKLSLENVEFDLVHTAYEAAELFAVSAHTKGLELVCAIEGDVPQKVYGDPSRVRQVLGNLIGNAIKFTEKGEVVLRVSRAADTGESTRLRFEVTDSGIGIPEAAQPVLFTAFSQADTSMSRRYGGTGLGLAICRQLVELMGGEIGFESTPSRGSTFWFVIPMRCIEGQAPQKTPSDLRGLRALVVDDNSVSRTFLCELLTHFGVGCDGADGAISGLARLRSALAEEKPYHIALIDVSMPQVTGMDLALILSGDPAFDDLHIVLLDGVDQQRGTGARLRAHGSVTKPVRAQKLCETLMTLMSRPQTRQKVFSRAPVSLRAREVALSAPAPVAPPHKEPRRRALVVDDHPINREVASNMMASLGFEVDLAENGREAVDAVRARPYSIVLMDLQMPVLDGYGAVREIRALEGTARHTPIVAATAHAMASDRERAHQAGLDDYIAKPIQLGQLSELVERWAQRGPLAQAPEEPTPETEAPPPEDAAPAMRQAIDFSVLEELRRYQRPGDPDLVLQIIGTFLEDLPRRQEALRDAAEKRDIVEVSRCAHALKSASATMGARELSRLAEELEHIDEGDAGGRLTALHTAFEAECSRVEARLREIVAREGRA